MTFVDTSSFVDAHGVTIATYAWPIEHPSAVVQLSHGIGEHAGRYSALAADLNAAGFSVVADDHRGHGATGRAQWAAEPGRTRRLLGPGGLAATVEAIHRFTLATKAANPGVPLVLVAHSWGSLMAQIDVNRHAGDYDGLVLSGTAYRMFGWMDAGDLNRKHRHLGTTGAEWLSRDEAVASAWLADPLTFEAAVRTVMGTAESAKLLGRPGRRLGTDLPLLIQVGGDDTLGGGRSAERLARAYRERSGLTDVGVKVYEGARHEVYNETNREQVIGDLIAWIREHVVRRHGVGA